MSTNAPQFSDPGDHSHRRPFTVFPSPAPPPKQLGTIRIMDAMPVEAAHFSLPALIRGADAARIQELESEVRSHLENAERGVEVVRSQKAQIDALKKENDTLKEALSHWQGVVRVAREKDSTLPDPEATPC